MPIPAQRRWRAASRLRGGIHHLQGNPQKYRIIGANSAFHGRTMATISAGNNAKHLEGFGPRVDGFDHVAFNNLNELRAAITEETAAVLVEPIQGEGGIAPADLSYLIALRETCDEFGILLIFDEVQCGVGRTGRLFAHQWADGAADPDLMAVAKGIGGGFPLGCFMGTTRGDGRNQRRDARHDLRRKPAGLARWMCA